MKTSAKKCESQRIVVVGGGGRVGSAIMERLADDGRYDPFALETDYGRLRALDDAGFAGAHVSGTDPYSAEPFLRDAACIVCAAPPNVAVLLARAAREFGCDYVDVCEDVAVTAKVTDEAAGATSRFVPGAGLAPGLVTAMIDAMIRRGGPGADITAYVGVLPEKKINRLGYGNIWGVDGLIAEYTQPAEAIVNGAAVVQPPLDAFETLTVNGDPFEAFTTSGSLGSLVRHHAGRIQGLQSKTLRFRGHLDYIRFLLDDLKLSERHYMFRNLLLNGLDDVQDDQVILHLLDRDPQAPREITHVFGAVPLSDGRRRSAVADVTALHVCAVVEALREGLAPGKGVLHHHDLSLEVLTATRFGRGFEFSE